MPLNLDSQAHRRGVGWEGSEEVHGIEITNVVEEF